MNMSIARYCQQPVPACITKLKFAPAVLEALLLTCFGERLAWESCGVQINVWQCREISRPKVIEHDATRKVCFDGCARFLIDIT